MPVSSYNVRSATALEWDAFLCIQPYTPFLQSFAMGDVYTAIHQDIHRIAVWNAERIVGIALLIYVPAKRGSHITIPYGPVIDTNATTAEATEIWQCILTEAMQYAAQKKALFIRISPHSTKEHTVARILQAYPASPMHLLAENIWYIPLQANSNWQVAHMPVIHTTKEEVFANLRKTTRNLIRRAEKDGVTITRSSNPMHDIDHFIRLHDETRKRHKFTPYSNAFFRAQVETFSKHNQCSIYLAWFEGTCISSSIHMHFGQETSYHHGASSSAHSKIPASYLLQWHAICDAIDRGDRVYNFWGIAPVEWNEDRWQLPPSSSSHPFAGVSLFKMGFGGTLLPLVPCHDIPLSRFYSCTRLFEILRKWKRGF
jgi:peptidoglycan pentaglycine glycine transferase (the first glycine)